MYLHRMQFIEVEVTPSHRGAEVRSVPPLVPSPSVNMSLPDFGYDITDSDYVPPSDDDDDDEHAELDDDDVDEDDYQESGDEPDEIEVDLEALFNQTQTNTESPAATPAASAMLTGIQRMSLQCIGVGPVRTNLTVFSTLCCLSVDLCHCRVPPACSRLRRFAPTGNPGPPPECQRSCLMAARFRR